MFTLRRRTCIRWLPPIDSAVAVAGDQPDVEVGVGQLRARGEGRRAAVDRVEAVAFDVIGEAARAADAGDEHGVFRVRAQLSASVRCTALRIA